MFKAVQPVTASHSVHTLAVYWFNELGCRPEDLIVGSTIVVPHGTLEGYNGLIAFETQKACVVSAPKKLVSSLREKLTGLPSSVSFDPEYLSQALDLAPGITIEKTIGPAWLGQLSEFEFRPQQGDEIRPLLEDDLPRLHAFFQQCQSEDVGVSSLDENSSGLFAAYAGDRIAAVSGYKVIQGKIAHIGVLTAPHYRGKGMGRKAVSATAEYALKNGLGIQYRTLMTNIASIHLARSLGFSDFAKTIAVRLKGSGDLK